MKLKKSTKCWALLVVSLLTVFTAGCNRGHNDNVQSEGPDHLPLRLQLPKAGSIEAFRILQYSGDDVTRRVQQSVLTKGPFAGGRQIRLFDNNNTLAEIRIYYPSMGGPERIGYRATFINGRYDTENQYAQDGTRQAEGHRLTDGTFERNTFFPGGNAVYLHAIFGRLMSDSGKLEWKPFSHEVYRDNSTVGAVQQLMDDGGTVTQFYDEKHTLTEVLLVNKAGVATCETDYRPDGKTPLIRYDFADKIVWAFDEKGQISLKDKWWFDESQQLTVYKDGKPVLVQNWEVDKDKSDKTATPPKIVLYLQWAREVRQDGSIVKEVTFFPGTKTAQTIEVPGAPPADAKLKDPEGLPILGSTTPAKTWTPPPAGAKAAQVKAAATTGATTTPATTTTATPFWTPSGAKEVFTYSKNGYLIKDEIYVAGKSSADRTVTHKEGAHIKARFDKSLYAPLPAGMRPLDKPKDPTPAMATPSFSWDDMDF